MGNRVARAQIVRIRRLLGVAAVLLAVAIVPSGVLAGAPEAATYSRCQGDHIQLRGSRGVVDFRVELARSDAERARGLMGRRSLAPDAGMLFVFDPPVHAYFWMKNTLIPLDMIFIGPRGRVRRVVAMARPGDLTQIDGGSDVALVLEINGGQAAAAGIAAGTVARSPVLDQARAIWPCPAS